MLAQELGRLEAETFEIEDLTDPSMEMGTCATGSSCSTSSCCSCSTSSCCATSSSSCSSTSSCG